MDEDFHDKGLLGGGGGGGVFPSQLFLEDDGFSMNQNNHCYHYGNGSFSDSISSGRGSLLWTSSGSTTPLDSELGSTEMESDVHDDDFIAELTRQMTDTMLRDDDDENSYNEKSTPDSVSEYFKGSDNHSEAYLSTEDKAQALNLDQELVPIHCYQLQNQPVVKREGSVFKGAIGSGKGAAKTERLNRQVEPDTEPDQRSNKKHRRAANKKRTNGSSSGFSHGGVRPRIPVGSDMRIVFLGGSGIKTGSCGTGVFLPRSGGVINPTEPPKKSGCSTVLIPARVLHVLNSLHFNGMDAVSQSNGCSGLSTGSYFNPHESFDNPREECKRSAGLESETEQNEKLESETVEYGRNHYLDLNLPQEWSYE